MHARRVAPDHPRRRSLFTDGRGGSASLPRRGADRQRPRQHHARRLGDRSCARATGGRKSTRPAGRHPGVWPPPGSAGGGRAAHELVPALGEAHRREHAGQLGYSKIASPRFVPRRPSDRKSRNGAFDDEAARHLSFRSRQPARALRQGARLGRRRRPRGCGGAGRQGPRARTCASGFDAHRDAADRVVVRINDRAARRSTRPGRFSSRGLRFAMLPKTEMAEEIAAARAAAGRPVPPLIETARGVHAIATAPGVLRLAFGTLRRRRLRRRARPRVSGGADRASRCAGIDVPIAGVTADIDDDARLLADLAFARAFGLGAKLCIHPKQVALIHKALLPSAAEIDWAERARRVPMAPRAPCRSTAKWSIARWCSGLGPSSTARRPELQGFPRRVHHATRNQETSIHGRHRYRFTHLRQGSSDPMRRVWSDETGTAKYVDIERRSPSCTLFRRRPPTRSSGTAISARSTCRSCAERQSASAIRSWVSSRSSLPRQARRISATGALHAGHHAIADPRSTGDRRRGARRGSPMRSRRSPSGTETRRSSGRAPCSRRSR